MRGSTHVGLALPTQLPQGGEARVVLARLELVLCGPRQLPLPCVLPGPVARCRRGHGVSPGPRPFLPFLPPRPFLPLVTFLPMLLRVSPLPTPSNRWLVLANWDRGQKSRHGPHGSLFPAGAQRRSICCRGLSTVVKVVDAVVVMLLASNTFHTSAGTHRLLSPLACCYCFHGCTVWSSCLFPPCRHTIPALTNHAHFMPIFCGGMTAQRALIF